MSRVYRGLQKDPTPKEILEHAKLRQQIEQMIGRPVRRWKSDTAPCKEQTPKENGSQ